MGKAFIYFTFLVLLLVCEIFSIILLKRSISTITEAKEDGEITDEEKSSIRVSIIQAVLCTIVTVLGLISVIA